MFASFLIGLVGGQRAMTPLAAAMVVLAAAELAGDKMRTAPGKIVLVGLAARLATSAIAGAALAPSRQRRFGAAVGGSTAVVAAYPGWRARIASIRHYGQRLQPAWSRMSSPPPSPLCGRLAYPLPARTVRGPDVGRRRCYKTSLPSWAAQRGQPTTALSALLPTDQCRVGRHR